ncbi:MAG: tetratricopeptide repeat protein [Patescibacteria group bacterium]|nr:tetratricopeptide repeat protein [Patescibacteria group bacterium]
MYLEKEEYAKAIAQLELAVAVQPNDRQTHESLIACYDRGNNPQGAIEQLLKLRELAPRDVALYKQLGERYAKLQSHGQAERAFTSIVEALPEEAESHALLAQVRQGQDRWSDAVPHWERVAQLRALEPQGLLGLAGALVHLERWDAAAEALEKLDAQPWPNRFGDVRGQTRALWRKVEAGKVEAGKAEAGKAKAGR